MRLSSRPAPTGLRALFEDHSVRLQEQPDLAGNSLSGLLRADLLD